MRVFSRFSERHPRAGPAPILFGRHDPKHEHLMRAPGPEQLRTPKPVQGVSVKQTMHQ